MNNKRCIALFSGGLDSLLAVKIVMQQNIEVIPIYFDTGFFLKTIIKKDDKFIYTPKTPPDINVVVVDISLEFFEMLKNPTFGFGTNMNPCIDCKILMLKKAGELRSIYNAGFVITGEVLGQRPMTQNIQAMKLIEEKSGISGFLLRPLTAKNLPETEPEKLKWVDREKLLDFKGRGRKPQLELAKKFGLEEYIISPAGGCILTDPNFSKRLKDFLENENKITRDDVFLLNTGRHFRYNKKKFIIGRNRSENENLLKYKGMADFCFFDTLEIPGPVCVAKGKLNNEEKIFIASAVARYSDGKGLNNVKILFFNGEKEKVLNVQPVDDNILKKYII